MLNSLQAVDIAFQSDASLSVFPYNMHLYTLLLPRWNLSQLQHSTHRCVGSAPPLNWYIADILRTFFASSGSPACAHGTEQFGHRFANAACVSGPYNGAGASYKIQ